MPIPSSINDLSTNPASNSPSGSDPPTEGDNHIRALAAIVRQVYDGQSDTTDVAKGDALVGVERTATGSVATTGHDWLEKQRLHLGSDFGLAMDGTDQTANIVSKLGGLGASWEGELVLPIEMRCDIQQVLDALPEKAVLHYAVVKQTGSGYRQQLVGIMDNPPDANTDTAFMLVSSHYPDFGLNNTRTSGTTSGDAGLSGFSWWRGFYTLGSNGPRCQWQANFRKATVRTSEYSSKGVACFELITRSPERAEDFETWETGMSITSGDFIQATNGNFYRATSSGTSTVSPTHTSGSATVGGVTWAFESSFVPFGAVFYVDELGRTGNARCDTGYTIYWKQNPEDAEDMNIWHEAGGASKRIRVRYLPTDGSSVATAMPILDVTVADGIRMFDSGLSNYFYKVTDAAGFQLAQHGRLQATAPNNDTTPSVASVGRLVLSNSGATSLTGLDDSLPTQEVELYATNSNTTLVHSSTFFLKGATNAALANGNIVVMTRDYVNSGWIEKSRNF